MPDAEQDPEVTDEVLARRRIPCICPRQFADDPPIGVTTGFSTSRDALLEHVACSGCERTWTRINARR